MPKVTVKTILCGDIKKCVDVIIDASDYLLLIVVSFVKIAAYACQVKKYFPVNGFAVN